MSINHLPYVLGKRLNENKLTDEGISRVDALVEYLIVEANLQTCGRILWWGYARAKHLRSWCDAPIFSKAWKSAKPRLCWVLSYLEQLSDKHGREHPEFGFRNDCKRAFTRGQSVKVTFVSNDYHLQRIFWDSIATDEQGLLKVLAGQVFRVWCGFANRSSVRGPRGGAISHQGPQGQLFLLFMDVLTTYRVYLEGVVAGSFERDSESVRQEPERLSIGVLVKARGW